MSNTAPPAPQAATPRMAATGERMVPEEPGARTFWEHVLRYRFAAGVARGRRVLDIACGEGYGTAALASVAASAVGVDVSAEAVEHGRQKYGIDARLGDAESIPLGDGAVDVVVSFETIEHVPHPAAFVAECARVMVAGGTLVMSTPEEEVYAEDHKQQANPFHCSEMSRAAFLALLGEHFDVTALYGQTDRSRATTRFALYAAGFRFYHKIRGSTRLQGVFRRRLERQTAAARASVTRTITSGGKPPLLARPYGLTPLSPGDRDARPTFVTAVATRR